MSNIINRNSIDVDYFIDDYFKNNLHFEVIEILDNYSVKIAEDDEYLYYLLCDLNDMKLSVIRYSKNIQIGRKTYFQINKSYSWIKDNGYGSFLYKYSIEHINAEVLSDKLQSRPGSFNIWKKLIKDDRFNIKLINTLNNRIYEIKKPLDEYEIWGAFEHQIKSVKEFPFDNVYDEVSEEFVYEKEYLYTDKHLDINIPEDVIEFIRRGVEKKAKIRNREQILLLVKVI